MNKKIFLISQIIFISILVIIFSINVYAQSTVTGRFTTQNTRPGIPADMMIQQHALNCSISLPQSSTSLCTGLNDVDFDHYNYQDVPTDFITGMNTHMVYNSSTLPLLNGGTQLWWNASIDPEANAVETLLCIGTDEAAISSGSFTPDTAPATIATTCDIVNKFVRGNGIPVTSGSSNPRASKYQFAALASENKFYYGLGGATPNRFGIKMYGHELGTADDFISLSGYFATVDLLNSNPNRPFNFTTLDLVVGNLNNQNLNYTHYRTPIIHWNMTNSNPGVFPENPVPDLDPDNGKSADRYPKDIVTFYIKVNKTSSPDTVYIDPLLSNSRVDDAMVYNKTPWSPLTDLAWPISVGVDGYAMTNYSYSIEARDYVSANTLNLTGWFTLYDFVPDILAVDLSDTDDISNINPGFDTLHHLCDTRIPGPIVGPCRLNPVKNNYVQSMNFTIVTFDKDADCYENLDVLSQGDAVPKNFSSILNFCNYTSVAPASCTSSSASFMFKTNRIFVNSSNTQCNYTLSTTLSGLASPPGNINLKGTPPFFVRVADPAFTGVGSEFFLWANVTSHSGLLRNSLPEFKWEYSGLVSADLETRTYVLVGGPTVVQLGGQGSIILDSWNIGTSLDDEYNLSNYGNMVLDVVWDSTDPTCTTPGTCFTDFWDLDNTFVAGDSGNNLDIDDDNRVSAPSIEPPISSITGREAAVGLRNFPAFPRVQFRPTTGSVPGLWRCVGIKASPPTCINPHQTGAAVFSTFWPIRPPSGGSLRPGTYESQITYALTALVSQPLSLT